MIWMMQIWEDVICSSASNLKIMQKPNLRNRNNISVLLFTLNDSYFKNTPTLFNVEFPSSLICLLPSKFMI